MSFAIPILAYHAQNIDGNDYRSNDLVAFASDLRTISAEGWRIASLAHIVDALRGVRAWPEGKVIGLSTDDGTDFDYADLPHPTWGPQRGMFGALADFIAEGLWPQPEACATSFVVVSPHARRELDRTCLAGRGWWSDDWWNPAIASGRWSIANHSWDHNHGALQTTAAEVAQQDTFRNITHRAAADAEIATAAAHLKAFAPNDGDALFAYPYGEANDYLVDEYFPQHGARIGIDAAFGIEPRPVTAGANRWLLPRYVCGLHWTSPRSLVELLRDAGRTPA